MEADDASQFKSDIDLQPAGFSDTFSAKKEEAKKEVTKKPQWWQALRSRRTLTDVAS